MEKMSYIKRNFDELFILGVFAKISLMGDISLSDQEMGVVAALRRMRQDWSEASVEKIGSDLAQYDESQMQGVLNNVKGIYHEMEFVRIENSDGDDAFVAIYGNTNHPEYDVVMSDSATGELWNVQLKAGSEDSHGHITEFLDTHDPDEILVTTEIAEKLGLETTGVSNEQIEARVEDVVDKLITHAEDSEIWGYLPVLAPISVALLIWELWGRHQSGSITRDQFMHYAALTSGLKLAKIAFLMLLLSIPGVNVITATALLARFLIDASDRYKEWKSRERALVDMGVVTSPA